MIHIENLTKYYKDFCAVDQINFDIKKSEILGLLGPNGAGKTTTLRMLTGYFMPTSGTIRVKDYQLDENLLEIKKLMGYLPESAPLYHSMLVYDYLDYVAGLRGLDKNKKISRIRQLVDLCGLDEIMHRSISELSKGLNQRVGLAHAMMDDPEILILDEPTSGLDPNQIAEIREIIRQIGEEKTVILSTHILSEVEATCDRVVIIDKGKIVANDRMENLKQSAGKTHFIHLDILKANFQDVHDRLSGIHGVAEIEKINEKPNGPLSVKVACKSDSDLREPVYHAIKQTDWVLIEFHQETKTLETIFRELTEED
ncbi:MAG: ATP-binding cassette domain-containing protein [Deltaproteobacteria bacterium]|nr:ATP-binding cassette domain-containing protein [Deltaproteobacteria bacterium]MBW2014627.1 ATP-binding cassette domain-containing protein [Deltaproteobacteria bacterium]MBW2090010.1 ATP-binding cassette domain-containing protein [Deltaproteobacteria bacterium]MBW2321790.1 ATP-binding cassette domain-containing protein [Deltaproteobacteria bacterium]